MQKRLITKINSYNGKLKATRDWQAARVSDIHDSHLGKEKVITIPQAKSIVREFENHWRVNITDIYTSLYDNAEQYEFTGWPISNDSGAVQLPIEALRPSYVIHECSHVIVEIVRRCWRHGKGLRDPGHGVLFCGVLAYSLETAWETAPNTVFDAFGEKLRLTPRPLIESFHREFTVGA